MACTRLLTTACCSGIPLFLWGAAFSSASAADGFLRGDIDGSHRIEVTDAIRIVQYLFQGQPDRLPCQDAGDVDDDGFIKINDALDLLSFLFHEGSTPARPFPECGADPTEDTLGCNEHAGCEFEIPGNGFSADGIFWVVDRGGSMLDSGELNLAKREVLRVLGALSSRAQFGVIFFDRGISRFPAEGKPAAATQGLKDAATSFVKETQGGHASCVQEAFAAALGFVGASTAQRNAIVYIGDGGGTCPQSGEEEPMYLQETLPLVTEANAGRARIYTIGVPGITPDRERFLENLARNNGGSYVRMAR